MVNPVHNMVHLAGTRWPVTPRMGTTPIPNRDRPPLRQRGAPFLPTHIQRLTVRAEHDRGDLRVAAEPAYLTRADVPAELEVRPTQPGLERFQPHRDRHMRTLTTLRGQPAFVQGVRADLPERIRLPLAE
ncbi:MAG: hypothetical protein QOF99_3961, partial [Pseudonocardiales bacterium]|nr:hypothetical protein [Pseudonocardiales bacterium]